MTFDESEPLDGGATGGGSLSQSVTHDDRLNFGGNDLNGEKKK